MNNILLANAEVNRDKNSMLSAGKTANSEGSSSENNEFSRALEQASQSNLQPRLKSAIAEEIQGEPAAMPADDDNANADVDGVLAQLNLASELLGGDEASQGGKSLPQYSDVAKQTVDDTSEVAFSGKDVNQDAVKGEASELATLNVNRPDSHCAAPGLDAITVLMQTSGLSKPALLALSSAELTPLINAANEPLPAINAIETKIQQITSLGIDGNKLVIQQVNAQFSHQSDEAQSQTAGTDKFQGSVISNSVIPNFVISNSVIQRLAIQNPAVFNPDIANQAIEINADATKRYLQAEKSTQTETHLQSTVLLGKESLLIAEGALLETKPAATTLQLLSYSESLQSNINFSSRSDLPQLPLSLKQASEPVPTMQQMIQRFAPVMKQQLIAMVSQGIGHAEIRLDPPELGQLMVRIQVQGDQAQVQFQVAQSQTRDVLEQAMPRLKDLLSEQGLQLTDSQVSQQQDGKEQGGGSEAREEHNMLAHFDAETDEDLAEKLQLNSNQMISYRTGVDYYA